MLFLKCEPGIVIDGVPTMVVNRKLYPPPKCNGSNNTSTQLHKEKNSNKDNLSRKRTLSLSTEKFLDHLF